MRPIILAALATLSLAGAAQAGWSNGVSLNGISGNGIRPQATRPAEAAQPVRFEGITLPGGATLNSDAR